MELYSYTLSVHSRWMEGLQLSREGEKLGLYRLFVAPPEPSDPPATVFENLAQFLEAHRWNDNFISLLLPAEDVIFRTLSFPFQDKKKIQHALPFEVENELLGDATDVHYIYHIYPLADGSARVLLMVIQKAYLEALKFTCNQRELLLKNVDCSAHALFETAPWNREAPLNLQVYLGADEAFINVIEQQQLQTVKIFPSRIPSALQQLLRQYPLPQRDFLEKLLALPAGLAPSPEEAPDLLHDTLILVRKELQGLCSQFALFLRAYHYDNLTNLTLHGLLGSLLEWNGLTFTLRSHLPETLLPTLLPPAPIEPEDSLAGQTQPPEEQQVPVSTQEASEVPPEGSALAFSEVPAPTETESPNPPVMETEASTSSSIPADSEASAPISSAVTATNFEASLTEAENQPSEPPLPASSTEEDRWAVTPSLAVAEEDQQLSANNEGTEETDQPLEPNTEAVLDSPAAPVVAARPLEHWGILAELARYELKHLEGHSLTFYSEATPWRRFFRKYRFLLITGTVLLVLTSGLWVTNYILQIQLLKAELQVTQQQVMSKLRQLMARESSEDVKALVAILENEVRKKKEDLQRSEQFSQRDYRTLKFLQTISTMLEKDVRFRVDRLEFTKERLSINGVIDSYENLQALKSGIAAMEGFKGKDILESNHNSPDGIIYRITVNR